ncbi:MAG: SAM-dependent methyltransferase, partial [Nocardioides sp.]
LEARRQTVRVGRFGRPEDFRGYFKDNYGPTIAVYRSLGADSGRIAALDTALDDLARRFGADEGAMDWEYLLVTARRS